MKIITEPIYKANIYLNFRDAFQKAKALAKGYKVKSIDPQNGKIILDINYAFKLITYLTWIKEVIIHIIPSENNSSVIEVYGKPALSPHHLLRTAYFIRNKIDKDQLFFEITNTFRNYEINDKKRKHKESNLRNTILFWVLELASISTFIWVVGLKSILGISIAKSSIYTYFVLLVLPQTPLVIWFIVDCYNRRFNSYSKKIYWISILSVSGFIGSAIYYFLIYKKSEENGKSS